MKTINQKTTVPKPPELAERWLILDATDAVLGRLATVTATLLRGKDLPNFTPHLAGRTHVVIVNAAAVRVTGDKLNQKTYFRHGGRPGSLRHRTLGEQLRRDPTVPIREAVRRMLPDNKLRQVWLNHLHVYPGPEHDHAAQQPVEVTGG